MRPVPQPRATPRIPPVSEPDEAQHEILAKAPRRPDGTVRNIFLTLAQHPMLLKRFNAFAGTFIRFGLVPAYDRELVVLRVAARIGSRYEYGQHLAIAREAGLADDTIRAVMLQAGAPALNAADELVVRAADEFTGDGDVTDVTWAQLAERYPPPALLELLMTAGFYRMTGEVLTTIGVQLEEEPDLAVSWDAAREGAGVDAVTASTPHPMVSAAELRDAMGYFATGVTVVTSRDADGNPVGTTANAVSSLSLEPPLILVCFDQESLTLAAVRQHGAFAVNVLAADHAALSSAFAQRGSDAAWELHPHDPGPTESPRLRDVLATLECAVEHRLAGGDHEIVVGRVVDVATAGDDRAPLLYYRGGYAALADA